MEITGARVVRSGATGELTLIVVERIPKRVLGRRTQEHLDKGARNKRRAWGKEKLLPVSY